jgi:hypothetical protein
MLPAPRHHVIGICPNTLRGTTLRMVRWTGRIAQSGVNVETRIPEIFLMAE